MAIVVRDDLSVPIPEEVASAMGLRRGSSVRWERLSDGSYVLRPLLTRQEAARRLHGMLAHTLKPGESAVAELIQEREQDAIRDESA